MMQRRGYQGTLTLSLEFFSQHLPHGLKHKAGLNFGLTQGNGPNLSANTLHIQDSILQSDCRHLLEIPGLLPLD